VRVAADDRFVIGNALDLGARRVHGVPDVQLDWP
jgi:hypothetical protein